MNSIVKFSEASSIALHGTILIAKSDKYLNVKKIAELLGGSSHHVAKVMQRLSKDGYIRSMRGPTGGFILVKKPEEISFLDLYQSVEGTVSYEKWPEGSFNNKLLSEINKKMTKDFTDYMGSKFVSDFI